MTDALLKTFQMTYANESYKNNNWSKYTKVAIRNGSGNNCVVYTKFALPGGFTHYTSGKLRIYAAQAVPSRTYVCQMLTQQWDYSKITYGNRPPGTTTNQVTVTKALAKNGYLEFDVTTLLNNASAAKTFHGFLIYMPTFDSNTYWFYKEVGTYGPVLSASYNSAPRKPVNLNPANDRYISTDKPIMTCDFSDPGGNINLSQMRVQIDTEPSFASPDFDSDWYGTSIPQIDMNDHSFTISTSTDYYWRANQRDGDGNESGWSDPAKFRRASPPVPAILLSPAASPNNYIEDATPTILWEVSTQKEFQIILWDESKTAMIANTGKITMPDERGFEISLSSFPAGVGMMEGRNYVVELRVWDYLLRSSLPNSPAHSSVERVFQYRPSLSVSPTVNLAVTQVGRTPWAQLDFDRNTTPDFFDIFRDGLMIKSGLQPDDLLVSGSSYRWVDKSAAPRTPHTWEVKAKENGRQSYGNPKVTKEIKAVTAFLCVDGTDIAIPFLEYAADISRGDGSYIVNILNSDEAVTVYQGQTTRQGEFSGIISGEVQTGSVVKTSRDYRKELLSLGELQNQGRLCYLSWADESIAVAVSQIDSSPVVYQEEICYLGTFYVTERPRAVQS